LQGPRQEKNYIRIEGYRLLPRYRRLSVCLSVCDKSPLNVRSVGLLYILCNIPLYVVRSAIVYLSNSWASYRVSATYTNENYLVGIILFYFSIQL